MIQAADFRVNNAVYCKYRHGHYLVKEITEDGIRIAEPARGYKFWESYETIIPIELSPELLESCGFIKETGDYFKDSVVYSNKIRLYQHDNNDYSLYGFNECKVWVFYLHELQNLFASLTGTELSINLEKVKA